MFLDVDKLSRIVVDAMRKKHAKDMDVRLFTESGASLTAARQNGYVPVLAAEVAKYSDYPDFPGGEKNPKYAACGELVYMVRPMEMKEEELNENERLVKMRETAAGNTLAEVGERLNVPTDISFEMK